MDTQELLRKVRKLEIKTRRLSDQLFSGEYHSSFKGRGMAFSEVRKYQFGDDIRAIDWNVTARKREPFIKVFEEDLTEPVEDEDEYEEISIPSPSELNVMTKSGILKEADKLGFELTGTKNQMIEQFSEQTEAFIAQLQEDGEFLSASDTDEGVEDDGDENNRDGGYF